MFYKLLIFFISAFTPILIMAQESVITYYGEVESIIINNCAPCHKKEGYGPFELTNYKQVKNKGKFISHVVESRYMPPWRADIEFRSFKNQRVLSKEEINTITTWINQGMKKGKFPSKNIEIPSLNELGSQKPDLILEMSKPYNISDSAIEDFRFFHIPTNLKKDTYIKSIAFVPDNKQLVHHSRIMADTSNLMAKINGMSEMDPELKKFQQIPLADEFLYGWVPGNFPVVYPDGTGKKIYANTDLILNIHYSPSSIKKTDQSKILLYLCDDVIENEIKTLAIRENDISNQPFIIPANIKKTFYVSYKVNKDINVVSIMPHMHFLGKSFKALAVTQNQEVMPLIKIDDWDFNWQSTYLLDQPLIIPANSVILITAEYDNTSDNSANPNNPPIDVGYGWNTTDEMMNLVLYYYCTTIFLLME